MIKKRKILFITGTRADYGKIKTLMKSMDQSDDFQVFIYVSGMHLLERYGGTYQEVLKDNYTNVHVAFGQQYTNSMSYNLGDVLRDLTGYVNSIKPDMILVHGDRSDALAGAIVGALNNIIVSHIEGGEISGTIDDSIRHAITKFAHLHFVANEEARLRLEQMGEDMSHVFIIGSPDIDVMLGQEQADIQMVKQYYDISFDQYGIFMYHPVTTEYDQLNQQIHTVMQALIHSKKNYVVVYPNNDYGTEIILNEISKIEKHKNFAVYPSIRFEYFISLLKNADFVIGNSSAGIREAGIFGIPAIDIGSRQWGRYDPNYLKNIQHVSEDEKEIREAIEKVDQFHYRNEVFGSGNSTDKFLNILQRDDTWECEIQKRFMDL